MEDPSDEELLQALMACFHSIRIPSEWGFRPRLSKSLPWPRVSIQLGSPASGDQEEEPVALFIDRVVSIQLGSPASGDLLTKKKVSYPGMEFPFN